MTESRAPAEPNVTSFETEVSAIRDGGCTLELAETYFYPAGGGQPADRGTIGGVTVTHVAAEDGVVEHHLAESANVAVGQTVVGQIDPAFRTYCRRAHTASHVLYGAGRRLFEELGYGGFDIDEERVRVDLTVPGGVDDGALVELERLTNRAIWDARPVTWETVPKSEALGRDAVAFNTATEEGLTGDTVRVVRVADWDVAACGGTHVENTREIGPVTVLERSNPGEGLSRVEFAVGPTGIERRATESEALRAAATALGVPTTEIDSGVIELQERYERVLDERDDLQEEVLEGRIADFATVDHDGETWRIGILEGYGPNDLGPHVRDPPEDLLAVVGRDGGTFVLVGSAGDTEAGAIVDAITETFGGGGGGGPAFAQGGGLDADPAEIVSYLETY